MDALASWKTISIHAPRAGGDLVFDTVDGLKRNFNPRPPRGGRQVYTGLSLFSLGFQSTPPARGATTLLLMFAH